MSPRLLRLAVELLFAGGLIGIGWHFGRLDLQADWDTEKLVHAQQLTDAVAAGARRQGELSIALNKAGTAQRDALKGKKNEEAAALARLDTERVRVVYPAPSSISVPGAAPDPRGDSGACPTGLPRADGEFLIRFAREADEAVIQLQACQQMLELERQQ